MFGVSEEVEEPEKTGGKKCPQIAQDDTTHEGRVSMTRDKDKATAYNAKGARAHGLLHMLRQSAIWVVQAAVRDSHVVSASGGREGSQKEKFPKGH
ncbi:hypothetical protein EON65_46135 [archaeon]|nr:MAG: hypothetical protein EON65_46135 [archaeon]